MMVMMIILMMIITRMIMNIDMSTKIILDDDVDDNK